MSGCSDLSRRLPAETAGPTADHIGRRGSKQEKTPWCRAFGRLRQTRRRSAERAAIRPVAPFGAGAPIGSRLVFLFHSHQAAEVIAPTRRARTHGLQCWRQHGWYCIWRPDPVRHEGDRRAVNPIDATALPSARLMLACSRFRAAARTAAAVSGIRTSRR
jgi:hypothetical protein